MVFDQRHGHGGVSDSRLEINENGTGVFSGRVSLDNNKAFVAGRWEAKLSPNHVWKGERRLGRSLASLT